MRNTVKILKKLTIVSSFAVLAACSSGGSGTIEGLNLTGTWQGLVFETEDIAYDVVVNIAQEETVGTTGGPESAQITYSITFLRSSDPDFPPCIGTLAGETATITFNSQNPILTGDGLSAFANNGSINGQIVVDGDDTACGGPLQLSRV